MAQIEIGLNKLERLFNEGHLCAAEIRCLNAQSKKKVWGLCLSSCAKSLHCDHFKFECLSCLKLTSPFRILNSQHSLRVDQPPCADLSKSNPNIPAR